MTSAAAAGAMVGGLAGTAVAPLVGTVIGILVGSAINVFILIVYHKMAPVAERKLAQIFGATPEHAVKRAIDCFFPITRGRQCTEEKV